MNGDELHDLIRQLRVELEWAVRTGIQPPPPPAPPPLHAERAASDDGTPPRGAMTGEGPHRGSDEPPPIGELRDPRRGADEPPPIGELRPPRRGPDGPPGGGSNGSGREPDGPPRHGPRGSDGPPGGGSSGSGRGSDGPPHGAPSPIGEPRGNSPGAGRSAGRPAPRPGANPHRPWEAYLPEDEAAGPRRGGPRRSEAPPRPSPGLGSNHADRSAGQTESPPPQTSPESVEPDLQERLLQAGALDEVHAILGPCVRCKLHRLGRKKIVFGVGPSNAEIMFVGEGPGADEDRIGEPFVGAAGQLLNRIIEAGMGMQRSDVYIANIVKCRPPRNRNPEPDEVERCEPFLKAQIRVIQPRVLVTLGKYAAQTLLRESTPITRLRGRWKEYEGIPVMPTFHPAYLLRNPAEKRPVWEDIQNVLKFLGRPVPGRG